ncbi:nitrous oxide reductase family maturation protein NosD [Halorientalis brevis]|uniref:Nitrous oxide reductase family maturation protein NosD n=1 Tax=Halorientalis brevis TaxID=1126241 RepID=A0ABD6C8F0_9EURY|nr:right-handed parallel beta-helix repeat-containing protein [Halorientalis brevis]
MQHNGDDNDDTETPTRRAVLRRGALTSAALATGVGATSAPATAHHRCTITVNDDGSADYSTIQAAIDAAAEGDTICVEPGSYRGTVTVDKEDLTLLSTKRCGASIINGDSETGAAVSIAAPGVTVKGFKVSFPDGLLGIAVQSGVDDVTIRKNVVTDVGPVGRLGATGIIGSGPHDNLTIAKNVVEDVTNEIDEDSNFPTVNGIFVDDQGSGSLTNSTIKRNLVRDLNSDVASIGIILGIDAENVSIRGNKVHDLVADPAVDGDDTDDAVDQPNTFAQGLNVDGGTTNVTITKNVVKDVRATFFVGTGLKIDGEADGLTVRFNDLLPIVGLENADDDTVTATCNFWGSPKGPRVVDTNREADDAPNARKRSAVVGPVEFEPWLVRSIRSCKNLEKSCVGGRGRRCGHQ